MRQKSSGAVILLLRLAQGKASDPLVSHKANANASLPDRTLEHRYSTHTVVVMI